MTITAWDPVSYQPLFKIAAVAVRQGAADRRCTSATTCGCCTPRRSNLAGGLRAVADGHADEADIFHLANRLAVQCDAHAAQLAPHAARYEDPAGDEPDALHSDIFRGPRSGALGLLRDLQDLYVMAAEVDIVWTLVGQAARGARDEDLLAVVTGCEQETAIQLKWLRTRLKQAAPQALVVA